MANEFQGIESGKAELKDNYDQESTYEAVRRRRKKLVDKYGIDEEEQIGRDEVPKND